MQTKAKSRRLVGSSALLASTVEPGEHFGRFNLPMSTRELVWQLSNGTPCEVPRFWINAAMQAIMQCFGNADIKVEVDSKIAQLTPNRADLNDYGRRVMANDGTQRPGSPDGSLATETRKPASLPRLVRPRRIGWWEEYHCGCVSETVKLKRNLLGYCGTHGDNRRRAYAEIEWPNGQSSPATVGGKEHDGH